VDVLGKSKAMIERKSAMHPRSEWCDALRELTLCCAGDDPCDTPDRLRELNSLLLNAPAATPLDGLKQLGSARLEALIQLAAYETAVMAMMGTGMGFLVSRNGAGHSLATVAVPGVLPEISGSGITPALALIGALALSLASVEVCPRTSSLQALTDVRPALH
jgi:hypothetical protein